MLHKARMRLSGVYEEGNGTNLEFRDPWVNEEFSCVFVDTAHMRGESLRVVADDPKITIDEVPAWVLLDAAPSERKPVDVYVGMTLLDASKRLKSNGYKSIIF